MNIREGIDITKMAIGCMLLALLIGAVFIMWYLVSGAESKVQRNMDTATNSAATERLYEMQDATFTADASGNYEDYPLVTNVCSTLSEYNEDSLLFVYCTARDIQTNTYSNSHWYTYEDVILNNLPSSFPGVSTATQLYPDTQIPITYAVKELFTYTQYRCRLQLVDYNYDNMTYTGIIVEVLVGEV